MLVKEQSTEKMASPAGFEPATYALEERCSILLSYGDLELIFFFEELFDFSLKTFNLLVESS